MSNGLKLLDSKRESALEKVTPLGNIVLIKPDEGAEFERGIAMPDTVRKNPKYPRGTVYATGPGRMLECGQMCPTGVVVGDKVIYNAPPIFAKINEIDMLVVDSAMILAIVQRDVGQ